jgi:hypothetical protein
MYGILYFYKYICLKEFFFSIIETEVPVFMAQAESKVSNSNIKDKNAPF